MSTGRVYLVGAGPGDAGLITRRGIEALERADIVLHDRLVDRELLRRHARGAELRDVGKRPGGKATTQEAINNELVERARGGATVVRLKGGDPFVFGRGGEEAEALADAGIAFEVVPGITAGVGAPAYAGIPVTHRDLASAVAFFTGHEDPEKPETTLDWSALAAFPGTLVVYMGAGRLREICARLVDAGRETGQPVAVVERGTMPGQRVVHGTLATIADRAEEAGVAAPAVIVAGEVAALAERVGRLGSSRLEGRSVTVTRARAQASELALRLHELGAEVVEAPAIRIEPRPVEGEVAAAVEGLDAGDYALVCLTSPNGAELLFAALRERGLDARALAGATVAAIGPGTARALELGGISPDVVPERSVAEALVEALSEIPLEGRRVLVARAAEARDVLPDALRERGADVDVVALYDTVAERLSDEEVEQALGADYVTFTASSTVRFFLDAVGGADALADSSRLVSIGPVTSAALREHGLEPAVEADRHDIEGLVAALLKDAGG